MIHHKSSILLDLNHLEIVYAQLLCYYALSDDARECEKILGR